MRRRELALEAAMTGLAQRPPILDLEADLRLWTGQPIANPDPAGSRPHVQQPGLCDLHLGFDRSPKGRQIAHRALVNLLQCDADG